MSPDLIQKALVTLTGREGFFCAIIADLLSDASKPIERAIVFRMKSSPETRIRDIAPIVGMAVAAIFYTQSAAFAEPPNASRSLKAGALVDFADDVSGNPHFAASHIDGMMKQLKGAGASQVSWSYYADAQGGYRMANLGGLANVRTVYNRLGNPLAAAVRAGHNHGLEVFGYFKPYEMGVDKVYPEGSPEASAHGLFDRIRRKNRLGRSLYCRTPRTLHPTPRRDPAATRQQESRLDNQAL